MTPKEKEIVGKPSWDARQKYIELIMLRLQRAGDVLNEGDFKQCFLELKWVYVLVAPWITKADASIIKDRIDALQHVILAAQKNNGLYPWASQGSRSRDDHLESSLLEVTGLLTSAAKTLFLPGEIGTMLEEWDFNDITEEPT